MEKDPSIARFVQKKSSGVERGGFMRPTLTIEKALKLERE